MAKESKPIKDRQCSKKNLLKTYLGIPLIKGDIHCLFRNSIICLFGKNYIFSSNLTAAVRRCSSK